MKNKHKKREVFELSTAIDKIQPSVKINKISIPKNLRYHKLNKEKTFSGVYRGK